MSTSALRGLAVLTLALAAAPARSQALPGQVAAESKISATAGGFGGDLDDLDWFGRAVASAGDVDGDGLTDLVVGAPRDDDGGLDRGAVWVLFLDAAGQVTAEQKISDLEGDFHGELDDEDTFGMAVASVGDINGDGTPDLAVGARGDGDGGPRRGAVWVLFLGPSGKVLGHQKISQLAGDFGGQLEDADHFGTSVDALGDLDGDGHPDLLVGANGCNDGGPRRGSVWIVFLDGDGTVRHEQKISQTEGGFAGQLGDGDRFGIGAGRIGDLDGDGRPEIGVGAFAHDTGGTNRGSCWVLFLNADGTAHTTQLIASQTGGFSGALDDFDYFGAAVAGPGDLDGDGLPDLAVGARRDDDGGFDHGAVWILRLAEDGTVTQHQKISATEGDFGGQLDDGDELGRSLAALGDIDADGVPDIVSGCNYDDDGGFNQGAVWLMRLRGTVWESQGLGLGGLNGVPQIKGSGSAEPRTRVILRVQRAKADSLLWWVLGTSVLLAPFHGGILIPAPDVVLGPEPTDATGKALLSYDWPAMAGPEAQFVHQAWIRDTAGVDGFSSTPALTVTAP